MYKGFTLQFVKVCINLRTFTEGTGIPFHVP